MDTYSLSQDKRTLTINDMQMFFKDEIEVVLKFPSMWVVLLCNICYDKNGHRSVDMAKQPLNNIYAVDKECNILWNIKQIATSHLGSQPNEHYTGAKKLSENSLRVMTFRGLTFDIDINACKIINTIFTK